MKKLALVLIIALLAIGLWAEEGAPVTVSGELTAEGVTNNKDVGWTKVKNKVTIGLFDIGTIELAPHYKYRAMPEHEIGLFAKLKAEYSMGIVTAGTSIESADPAAFNVSAKWKQDGAVFKTWKAWVDLEAGPVHFDVDAKFSMEKEVDFFQGVEFSGLYTLGPAEVRLGYLLTETAEGKVNGPAALTNGGIFGKFKVTY